MFNIIQIFTPLGELTEQTDAKQQVSSFEYDKLGRMTRRTEGADISTWEYDTAVNGKGKLASATSSNGFARNYTYDSLSRPKTTTTTIGGISYDSEVTYDGSGRVILMDYPSGFAVRNVYNAQGHLVRVEKADDASLVYWRLDAVNADGQITEETRDAGISVERTYGTIRGRLERIVAAFPVTTLGLAERGYGNRVSPVY